MITKRTTPFQGGSIKLADYQSVRRFDHPIDGETVMSWPTKTHRIRKAIAAFVCGFCSIAILLMVLS